MTNWHKITLTKEQNDSGLTLDISEAFDRLYKLAKKPLDMAIFADHRPDGGGTIYFSPSCGKYALELIKQHNGIACPKPKFSSPLEATPLGGNFPVSELGSLL